MGAFEGDSEGLQLADSINGHMPAEVGFRCCSVYPLVCGSRQGNLMQGDGSPDHEARTGRTGARAERAARQPLIQRAEQLLGPHVPLLPAGLHPAPAPGRCAATRAATFLVSVMCLSARSRVRACLHIRAGGAEDAAVLERLQAALALYRGTHPFHNFTQRRLYRPAAPGQKSLWNKRPARRRPRAAGGAECADAAGSPADAPGEHFGAAPPAGTALARCQPVVHSRNSKHILVDLVSFGLQQGGQVKEKADAVRRSYCGGGGGGCRRGGAS